MSSEIEQKIKEIIQNTIGVKTSEIDSNGKLYEALDVDSTEMVEITVALEKLFGLKFEKNQVTKFSSVNDIVKAVTDRKGAQV